MPLAMLGGLSAYISSKTALAKLLEFAAAKYPNIFIAAVHPGTIDTAMFRKSGPQPESFPMDNGQLIPQSLPSARAGRMQLLTNLSLQYNFLHTSWCGWPVRTPNSFEGDWSGRIGMLTS